MALSATSNISGAIFQQAQGEITRLDALLDSLQNEIIQHKTVISLLLAERGQPQSGILGYRDLRHQRLD